MKKVAIIIAVSSSVIIGVGTAIYIFKKKHKKEPQIIKYEYHPSEDTNYDTKSELDESEEVHLTSDKTSIDSTIVAENINYSDYSEKSKKILEEAMNKNTDISASPWDTAIIKISPEEFMEMEDEGYSSETWTLYSDDVLVDEDGKVISKERKITCIGEHSFDSFDDFENDCMYIRNNEQKVDYEILLDEGEYSEIYHQ